MKKPVKSSDKGILTRSSRNSAETSDIADKTVVPKDDNEEDSSNPTSPENITTGSQEKTITPDSETQNTLRYLIEDSAKTKNSLSELTEIFKQFSSNFDVFRSQMIQKTHVSVAPSVDMPSEDGLLNDKSSKDLGPSNLESHRVDDRPNHLSSTRYEPNDGGYPPYLTPPGYSQVINQVNPTTFRGDRKKARSWLKHYENCMKINGYPDEQKFIRMPAYLEDQAEHWYDSICYTIQDNDWYSLKSNFLLHFCGHDGQSQLGKELDEAKQKINERPIDYMARIISLCHEYKPNMPEEEKIRKIAKGLLPHINDAIIASKTTDEWTIEWLRKVFLYMNYGRDISADNKSISTRNQGKRNDYTNFTCPNCSTKGHHQRDCAQPRDEARIKANIEAYKMKKKQKDENTPATKNRAIGNISFGHVKLPDSFPSSHVSTHEGQSLSLTIKINNQEVIGRPDTGADITVLPSNIANDLKLELFPWDQPDLLAANQTKMDILGVSPVLITYKNERKPLMITIVKKNALIQPIFGLDFLNLFGFKLKQFDLEEKSTPKVEGDITLNNTQIDQHPVDKVKFGNLDLLKRTIYDQELMKFKDVFSRDELDIGRTSTLKHRIILTDDIPVQKSRYTIPIRNKQAMEENINKLLTTGAIRPSSSPYASPVFLVDKDKGQDKRLVADFRALNAKTILDKYPMPHPEDIYSLFHGMNLFTKLDITAMFNQIEVDERDVHKTAIITHLGQFECPLMPFGLANAPATAVRLMNEVLRDINGKHCYVYFDDIIVFAVDIHQLIQRTSEVLLRLRQHNLKLKPSKCCFAVDTVSFLGHIITPNGIQVDPTRVERVLNFPIPRNSTDVRSFHGLCSFNRKFIKNFSDIAKPLTPLMGKPSEFYWNSETQQAFDKLKEALTKTPVLVHFNPEAEHELRTDASSFAIGAVLYQKHKLLHQTGVVLYYSQTLNSAQRNYSATMRELYAAYSAIIDLQHYLIGKQFTLVTDHSALSLLKSQKDPHQKLARWIAELQAFDFKVQYRKGSNHKDADCMSRLVKEISPFEEPSLEKLTSAPPEIIQSICLISSQPIETLDESLVDIRQEQRDDSYCKKYIDILESTEISEENKVVKAKYFTMQDDLLYRISIGDIYRLVIPYKRRNAVLLACHDMPLAGHLGFSKTYSVMKKRYYWPKMRKDTKKYVFSCFKCQLRKCTNTRKQGFIKPLPISEDIFDTLGVDLINKIPVSNAGYNSILVITDNLSKYAITVPLKNEVSETVCHAFFNQVIAKYGCPKAIITDNGTNLVSSYANNFFKMFGIKRHLTSPYHPQSNGQTERFNRTLATSLAVFVHKNQKLWSDYLQAVTFAYNITEHDASHACPFELVFGRRPRIPIDNLLDRNEFIDPTRPSSDIRSTAALEVIKQSILHNQKKNKNRLDSKLTSTKFQEGNLVVFERPTRTKGEAMKLSYTYTGPYEITRKISDLSFELRALPGCTDNKFIRVAHPCHLKPYIRRECDISDDIINPTFVPYEVQPLEPIRPQIPSQPRSLPDLSPIHEDISDQQNDFSPDNEVYEVQSDDGIISSAPNLDIQPAIQRQPIQPRRRRKNSFNSIYDYIRSRPPLVINLSDRRQVNTPSNDNVTLDLQDRPIISQPVVLEPESLQPHVDIHLPMDPIEPEVAQASQNEPNAIQPVIESDLEIESPAFSPLSTRNSQ